MQILKAGVAYFAVAFGAGFVLGTLRVLWLVPSVGMRIAELIEMPIMLVVIIFAARWALRRFAIATAPSLRLAVGFVALGLLLVAEFTFVLSLQGLTIDEYLAGRDPVSGTAYVVMLGAFAIMPLLVGRDARL